MHRVFFWLVLTASVLPAAPQKKPLNGSIADRSGAPVEGVLVITSGRSFQGWANSDVDGSFSLPDTGEFVTFRHEKFKPLLVSTSELTEPVRVRMDPMDKSVWKPSSCRILPGNRVRIGDALRIDPSGGYEGPEYGQHDSHWNVRRGKHTLHIVSGHALHAGLPEEEQLSRSVSISVRAWVFDKVVGLDFVGRYRDGTYWRWVGAPLSDAIEYKTASRETAEEFDRIIATMCYQRRY